uniref:Uncharacterized protein n=1 Tax=Salix viminalis TaxID=40686 RepID=A0A6N2K1H2_SALVM
MAACGGRSRRQKRRRVGVKRGRERRWRCCHWSREREAPSGERKEELQREEERLQATDEKFLSWWSTERETTLLKEATDDDSTCAEEMKMAVVGVFMVAFYRRTWPATVAGWSVTWSTASWCGCWRVWLAGSAGEGGKGSGEKNLACYGGWLVGDVATCNNGVVAAAGGLSTAWWLAGSTGEGGKGSGEVQWIRLSYRLVLQL